MIIFFTSGTTGEPKMVLHDQSYPLGHMVTAGLWHDLRHNDLHFTLSDTGWAKSAWGKIFGQWIAGAAIFVYDIRGRFKATEILPLLERYAITTFCCPPTIYRMLILADLDRFDFTELRHCTSAGEPLNPEVIRVWKEATGVDDLRGVRPDRDRALHRDLPADGGQAGLDGQARAGLDRRAPRRRRPARRHRAGGADRDQDSTRGRSGSSASTSGSEEENERAFVDGWYYTGDKAYVDEDGYFWFIGRDDDVIKSSGYRIGPFEVESALLEHPAVQEAAVVGSPDVIRGLVVKAFVVLTPGFKPSESLVRDIQTHVKKSTAPYKYPRLVEFVETLPKTISGKIKRNELRDAELRKFQNGNNHASVGGAGRQSLSFRAPNICRREGSQAWSTAQDSGSCLAGVLGFKSHPSHRGRFVSLPRHFSLRSLPIAAVPIRSRSRHGPGTVPGRTESPRRAVKVPGDGDRAPSP